MSFETAISTRISAIGKTIQLKLTLPIQDILVDTQLAPRRMLDYLPVATSIKFIEAFLFTTLRTLFNLAPPPRFELGLTI